MMAVSRDVGFTSKASVLKCDRHVRFGPIADSCTAANLFDHLVGALLNMKRHVESERLGGLDIHNQLKLGRLFDR
jgi:hypothetical protein